jgi:hypothetical protein
MHLEAIELTRDWSVPGRISIAARSWRYLVRARQTWSTQQREGIRALARGFLAAGSRRIVATDLPVDDEAAANLASYLTAGIAKPEQDPTAMNYAASLQLGQTLSSSATALGKLR